MRVTAPSPEGNFAGGALIGLLLALPIDAAIAFGIYSLVNWL